MGKYMNVSTRLSGRGLQYRSKASKISLFPGGESIMSCMGLQAANGKFPFLKAQQDNNDLSDASFNSLSLFLFSDQNSSYILCSLPTLFHRFKAHYYYNTFFNFCEVFIHVQKTAISLHEVDCLASCFCPACVLQGRTD